MKRTKILTIVIAGAIIFALAGMAMAQSATSTSSKPAANMTAKKETSAMKSTEMKSTEMKATEMTNKADKDMVASRSEMTSESSADDWSKIEAHYNEMMQMTDAAALKTEMAKHQEMIAAYRAKLMTNMEANHKNMSTQRQTMAKGENTKAMTGKAKPTTSH